ncbi:MAG TPA: heme biosynthesis protein HemY [Gammaproteobacteria bacterium]|nr:heme biosynthesis protein HemY [Gammaproteobacteria bacterium]
MKRLIWTLLLSTLLATAIGLTAYYNGPGYVVFTYIDYTVEISFISALVFMVVGFFVFYYVLRLLSWVLKIPSYFGGQYSQRKSERAKNAVIKGMIEMSEGRFEQAEKIFTRQADLSDTSLLNYLMAARSAQQLGAYDRRDEYLRLAHESTPSADMAIGLTQAELQLSHKQLEQALATLNHLSSVSPRHGYVKKLQARAYQQLGDWEHLCPILEDVRKMKAIDNTQLEKMEVQACTGRMEEGLKRVDGESIEKIWKQLPKHLKSNAEILALYCGYLSKYNKDDEAEVLLKNFLSNNWQDEHAILYSNLSVSDCQKQLETAETWLHSQSRNAVLLMVLGKLCLNCQLWGKARSYFESSIGIKPIAESYLKLAILLEEKMDAPEEAQKMYRAGLFYTVSDEPQRALQSDDKTDRPRLKVIQK